ncbi:MAG: S8 family peptidase [Vicinamibacterales bacterium]
MIRILENDVVKRAASALVLGAFLLAGAVPAYAQRQKGKRPHVDRMVEKALRDGRDIPVIVRYKDAAAGERVRKRSSGKRELRRHLRQSRALGMKVNHRALRELLDDESDDIESISYDAPVKGQQFDLLSEPAPVSVDASASKVARSRYWVSGSGIGVAVIDSGVRPHADLPSTRIKAFVDFVNGATSPYDDYGHGTHVAGIIAGNGYSSGGQYTGVAPNAGIVGLKVLNHNGAGRTSDVLAALEWVLANRTTYNIRVVNLSLGHPIYEPAATDPMVQLVEQLTRQGIVVVVSAGNMGRNALGQTVYGSITSPANAQGAIAVGAVDTMNTRSRGDDTVAPFSSRGPTRFDRYVKPDVLAPGYRIASLVSTGSTLAVKYPNLVVGSSYFRLNGTSQAAPVVSGAAALMLQANSSLTSHTVKGIIQFTAQRMSNLDVMTQGAGQVNIAGAVRFAKLVHASALPGKRWLKGRRNPIQADLLFGETAYWGKAVIWGTTIKPSTRALYMRLAQWDDNIVWGYMDDNIVWSMTDNIVWSMTDDNIVWGFTDDNIVWGFDDNIVWSMDDNIVWSMDDNIVWSMTDDSVLAFSEMLIGMSYEQEGGQQ